MKKSFLSAFCAFAIVVQLAMPARSEAAIGLLTGERGKPLVIAGGVAVAAGVGLFLASTSADDLQTIVVMQIIGAATALVGVVLLDEQPRPLLFKRIDAEGADRLALSSLEREEFNASIDEINAVSQQVGRELEAGKDWSIERSRALWEKYRARIGSEAAFSALGKVSHAWLQSLRTR